MAIYPLKFKPIYKQRIWGGQKLREIFAKEIPPDTKIGESWELADLPNDKSVISNGKFIGQTLGELLEKYPKEITGDENFSGSFPLLIKFLDAEDVLSVQVHPDRQTCRRIGTGSVYLIRSNHPGAGCFCPDKRQKAAAAAGSGHRYPVLHITGTGTASCRKNTGRVELHYEDHNR